MKIMKKKIKKITIIIVTLILLVPIPLGVKDGGTVKYQAVLYSITDYHAFRDMIGYDVGIEIKILGKTVYKNIRFSEK